MIWQLTEKFLLIKLIFICPDSELAKWGKLYAKDNFFKKKKKSVTI